MTSLRANLHEGFALLLDAAGNPVAEWWDKSYARAILNGECSVERWHEMFHKLAVERGYLKFTAEGWRASNTKA
jgi:hypothetical protein